MSDINNLQAAINLVKSKSFYKKTNIKKRKYKRKTKDKDYIVNENIFYNSSRSNITKSIVNKTTILCFNELDAKITAENHNSYYYEVYNLSKQDNLIKIGYGIPR